MNGNIAPDYIDVAAEIIAAFVSNNSVPTPELPALIERARRLEKRFESLAASHARGAPPSGPIKKSVSANHVTCLEDGKTFKSLKRHLRTVYDMTPDQYRAKWDLPADYPMVASNYAKARSEFAKSMGLGRRRRSPAKPRRKAAP